MGTSDAPPGQARLRELEEAIRAAAAYLPRGGFRACASCGVESWLLGGAR
jgi:hypothetical protein